MHISILEPKAWNLSLTAGVQGPLKLMTLEAQGGGGVGGGVDAFLCYVSAEPYTFRLYKMRKNLVD